MRSWVHYLPIVTTVLSAIFGTIVLQRWAARRGATHLAWWAAGIYIYGLGTLCEALTTLFGWNPVVFRSWYVTGALLGGSPLAQGSVYFHLDRKVANRLTVALVAYLLFATICVGVVPIAMDRVETFRLSGKVMEWTWVRLLSPVVNLYAVIFLIGGAILSALRYRRESGARNLFFGNALIAAGAIMPGIGGSFTRLGYTEVLYVTELIGLILIWIGYRLCTG